MKLNMIGFIFMEVIINVNIIDIFLKEKKDIINALTKKIKSIKLLFLEVILKIIKIILYISSPSSKINHIAK